MSDRPRRSPIALAIVFAITSIVTLATPRAIVAWSDGTFSSSSERELIALTNRSRAAAGLRSLRVDATLASVARWRSKDMIERDYFSHDIPGYGSVFRKLDSKGYCYKVAGENIGWNTYPDDDATAAIHRMFMDSSGHRRNILGRAWEVIGVGAYKGSDGKKMWTVLFADKCGSSSTSKPKPKPKPASKPAPKPAAKSTAKQAPKPAPKATPRPTPVPTATPAPTPTPLATSPLASLDLGDGMGASSAVASPPQHDPGSGLRVVEASIGGGLVDTIVGGVASLFFGA
jgi:uncharacterized protein YkwD